MRRYRKVELEIYRVCRHDHRQHQPLVHRAPQQVRDELPDRTLHLWGSSLLARNGGKEFFQQSDKHELLIHSKTPIGDTVADLFQSASLDHEECVVATSPISPPGVRVGDGDCSTTTARVLCMCPPPAGKLISKNRRLLGK